MELDSLEIYQKKKAVIEIAKRCFQQGLQTNSGGNLSVRLESPKEAGVGVDAIVIKPSGVGFNECSQENLMVTDLNGKTLVGDGKPSKDLDFHVALYRIRPDIKAIVHVHSPWATGWASAGVEIPCLTVQTIEKLGRVPLIPLSKELGPQTAEDITAVMNDTEIQSAILANHGTIGVGKTLMAACYLVEILEETAKIAFVRNSLLAQMGKSEDSIQLPQRGVKTTSK